MPGLLDDTHVAHASNLVVAIPNPFAASVTVKARKLNSRIAVAARAHTSSATEFLRDRGADHVIMGANEIARGMVDWEVQRGQAEPDLGLQQPPKTQPKGA
ncbi:Putative cation/proton antiporter YbaL [Gammaproteobacteria bacterium]|nr:Putative cation/proton antiporter YbaL [Gammaproteobacteria bacterium]